MLVRKKALGGKGLAVAGCFGDDFNDPARAEPPLTDGLRGFFRAQGPGDVPAMTDLLNRCQKKELAIALEGRRGAAKACGAFTVAEQTRTPQIGRAHV